MAFENARHRATIVEPPIAAFLFNDTRLAPLWLVIRLYAGYEWLMAGLEKLEQSVLSFG